MPIVTENIGPLALREIINDRPRALNRFCKLLSGSDLIAYGLDIGEAKVDTKTMTVGPVVISTPVVDRVGDVLPPLGLRRIDEYRANPIVHWEHGLSGEEGGSMPIANSEDADGNFALSITDGGVIAAARFHGKTKLSEQVFTLIDDGVIKATSVRAEPLKTHMVRDENGELVLVMDEWYMPEWSFGAMGVNPETLLKTVRDEKIRGQSLDASLLKSFRPLVPVLTATTVAGGMPDHLKALPPKDAKDDDDEKPKPTEGDEGKPPAKPTGDAPPPAAAKTDDAPPADAASDAPPADDKPVDQGTDEATAADAEPPADDVNTSKYGSQVLTAFHQKLAELTALLAEASGPVENPDVKVATDGILHVMSELSKTVEDLHGKVYGEQLGGGMDQQQPASDPPPDEEAIKSFLASGRVPVVTFKGCAYGLKTLLRDRTLSDEHRKTIVEHLERLTAFEVTAKSHVEARTKSLVEEETAKVHRNVVESVRLLNDFVPHLRGVAS